MDQVKKILTILKKQQFWVITGIAVVVVLVCWWLSTSSLAGQFTARKGALEGAFKSAMIPADPPNDKVIEAIRGQDKSLKDKVCEAWEILYKQQKEKNPLPSLLGDDFKQHFESLRPKEELSPQYLERYQNFIKRHIPSLLKLVNVRRLADQGENGDGIRPAGARNVDGGMMREGRTPGGGGENPEVEMVGTVYWNEADYAAIENRFEWKNRPSTLTVLLAQEDLWVYEALLRVIRNANEGASYANAAVKQIAALRIGSEAAKAWKESEGVIFKGGAGGPGMPGGEMGMGGRGEMGMGMGGPGGPGGSGNDDQMRRQLMEGRYFDDKDMPLPCDAEYPYAKHPYAEFKMMPIHMNLVMDERKLPRLLVECANSNMPIEVRRVRIRKRDVGAMDIVGAGPGGGGGGGGMMMEGGMPGGGMMGRGAPAPQFGGGMRAQDKKEESSQFDVPVDVYGIIYIYNPPDREKLGTGTAAEKQGEPGSPAAPGVPGGNAAPAAAPAGGPPKPP